MVCLVIYPILTFTFHHFRRSNVESPCGTKNCDGRSGRILRRSTWMPGKPSLGCLPLDRRSHIFRFRNQICMNVPDVFFQKSECSAVKHLVDQRSAASLYVNAIPAALVGCPTPPRRGGLVKQISDFEFQRNQLFVHCPKREIHHNYIT